MIVSYNWLKELVKLNVSAEKLAEEMSLYSAKVDKIFIPANFFVKNIKKFSKKISDYFL